MSNPYPFSLTKRKDCSFMYYVRFKNKQGKYLTWKSTGTKSKDEAFKIAYQWYTTGIPQKPTIDEMSLIETIRKSQITPKKLEEMLEECKRRNLLKSYVLAGSKEDLPAYSFFIDFWTWDKSEYIAEKLRQNHRIGKRYVSKQLGNIRNHWKKITEGKTLAELTKQDIKDLIKELSKTSLSYGAKNDIVRAGTTALKWAFNNELIEKDITTGSVLFSGNYNERKILSPELVQALFHVQWNDERAKLANMLALCTGLRAGEIQGLRMQDLGKDCLYVRHSWNLADGLKCTKNGEARTVELPFQNLTQKLLELAESNPHGQGMDGYVFWSTIPSKPMEAKTFLAGMRQALQKVGMSEATANGYTFHAWRHYFTAYMKDKIPDKVLQQQTGHKTITMLDHYADHRINGESERLRNAQIETFGDIVNQIPETQFNTKKMIAYVRNKHQRGKNE